MSVVGAIRDALATALTTLAAGNTGIWLDFVGTVTARKNPSLPPGKHPPAIVLSIADPGPVTRASATKVLVTYPILVVVFAKDGEQLGDDANARDRIEAIRKLVYDDATYAGVAEYNTVDVRLGSTFDKAAMEALINGSYVTASVETLEGRT